MIVSYGRIQLSERVCRQLRLNCDDVQGFRALVLACSVATLATLCLGSVADAQVNWLETLGIGPEGQVRAVCFSDDGLHVLAGYDDAIAILWDVASGRELRAFRLPATNKNAVLSVTLSADAKHVALGHGTRLGSACGSITTWNATTGQQYAQLSHGLDDGVSSLTFTQDRTALLTPAGIVDFDSNKWHVRFDEFRASLCDGTEDGSLIVLGDCRALEGKVVVRNAKSGRVRELGDDGHSELFGNDVCSIRFGSSGTTLMTACDSSIAIWEIPSLRLLSRITHNSSAIIAADYAEKVNRIAAGTVKGETIVFDSRSGTRLHSTKANDADVSCVAFAAGGRRFATGSADGNVIVYSTDDASVTYVLKRPR